MSTTRFFLSSDETSTRNGISVDDIDGRVGGARGCFLAVGFSVFSDAAAAAAAAAVVVVVVAAAAGDGAVTAAVADVVVVPVSLFVFLDGSSFFDDSSVVTTVVVGVGAKPSGNGAGADASAGFVVIVDFFLSLSEV